MTWKINWTDEARKQLRKLDKTAQENILDYMKKRISTADDPADFGKPLKYKKYGLWRYRVGDYRIVCQIESDVLTILVLQVGHRKDIYD